MPTPPGGTGPPDTVHRHPTQTAQRLAGVGEGEIGEALEACELGELCQELVEGRGGKGGCGVTCQDTPRVVTGEGRPGEGPTIGRELKAQITGFGEDTDQEAVGAIPVHGDTLLATITEPCLKVADGDSELDFAIRNEVQVGNGLKEASGVGVGPGHEELAEEGEGQIG